MTTSARWESLDLSGLVGRLEEARNLLEQAAALTAAHDGGRISAVAELHRRLAEEQGDHSHRRRYR